MNPRAQPRCGRRRRATGATDPVVVGLGRLLTLIGALLVLSMMLLWWLQ